MASQDSKIRLFGLRLISDKILVLIVDSKVASKLALLSVNYGRIPQWWQYGRILLKGII